MTNLADAIEYPSGSMNWMSGQDGSDRSDADLFDARFQISHVDGDGEGDANAGDAGNGEGGNGNAATVESHNNTSNEIANNNHASNATNDQRLAHIVDEANKEAFAVLDALWQELISKATPEWWRSISDRFEASITPQMEFEAAFLFNIMTGVVPPKPRREPKGAMLKRSPIKWFGGKYFLSKQILPLLPEHECYCEPFCGAAHVFFKKDAVRQDVINDINGELVNFYKQLQCNVEYFIAQHQFALHSRRIFNELRMITREELAKLSDEERAWRFYYLCQNSFGSNVTRSGLPTYGIQKGYGKTGLNSNSAASFKHNVPLLLTASARLQNAHIENLHYSNCIARYDGPRTLFYIDPPYYNHEKDYGKEIFFREDFERLASQLANIKGKFLLSINDLPETREIFKDFVILKEVTAFYTAGGNSPDNKGRGPKHAPELLIANYDFGELGKV